MPPCAPITPPTSVVSSRVHVIHVVDSVGFWSHFLSSCRAAAGAVSQAAKKAFKEGMAQMQVDLAVAAQKCGKKAIERARPYHAALFQAK